MGRLNAAGETIRPLTFLPGVNTPPEVSRAQIAINAARDIPWLNVRPLTGRPLVIVGGGPSLKERWPEIEERIAMGADVLALNNAYSFLVTNGIRPNFFMLMDARQENVDFLRDCLPETEHFLAAQCHPEVFDRLKHHNTCLYLTTLPGVLDLVKAYDRPKVQLCGSAGTVGIKALALAYALGYREWHLYGYDSSYEDGYHHAFSQTLNDEAKTLDVYLGDRRYVTTAAMAHQAEEFIGFAKELVRSGCEIELHCSGLLPDLAAYCNTVGEVPLEDREREKYQQMWTHDAYRKDAPGAAFVDDVIQSLGMTGTVTDYGSGTGRASRELQRRGLSVTAVDFADNAFENRPDSICFVNACLWDLPESLGTSDWAYCTDVMEHIPTEKVAAVIAGISKRTTRGAYFNIATRPDNLGALIGRKLHMTVMAAGEWQRLLSTFFDHVEMREREGEATFICKRTL